MSHYFDGLCAIPFDSQRIYGDDAIKLLQNFLKNFNADVPKYMTAVIVWQQYVTTLISG